RVVHDVRARSRLRLLRRGRAGGAAARTARPVRGLVQHASGPGHGQPPLLLRERLPRAVLGGGRARGPVGARRAHTPVVTLVGARGGGLSVRDHPSPRRWRELGPTLRELGLPPVLPSAPPRHRRRGGDAAERAGILLHRLRAWRRPDAAPAPRSRARRSSSHRGRDRHSRIDASLRRRAPRGGNGPRPVRGRAAPRHDAHLRRGACPAAGRSRPRPAARPALVAAVGSRTLKVTRDEPGRILVLEGTVPRIPAAGLGCIAAFLLPFVVTSAWYLGASLFRGLSSDPLNLAITAFTTLFWAAVVTSLVRVVRRRAWMPSQLRADRDVGSVELLERSLLTGRERREAVPLAELAGLSLETVTRRRIDARTRDLAGEAFDPNVRIRLRIDVGSRKPRVRVLELHVEGVDRREEVA